MTTAPATGFATKALNVITLFTEDLAATKSFYQQVLGLIVVFEDANSAVFKLENLMINLLDASAAPALVEPAAVAGPEAGSRFVLSVFVDDVDVVCAELARRGVTLLNGPIDRPWEMRTASFTDPAGHVWEVAQDLV